MCENGILGDNKNSGLVVLVNNRDGDIGLEDKLIAHEKGELHRAFSVFIFNNKGEMLLQKRAKTKYHSKGLWTNACCGHPKRDESVYAAAFKRLYEEMGFNCTLQERFSFIYKGFVGNGLTEHEFDHVFIGKYNGPVKPDPDEAEKYAWRNAEYLEKDVSKHPSRYSYWFRCIFKKVLDYKKQ